MVALTIGVFGAAGVAYAKTNPLCSSVSLLLHELEAQVEGLSMLRRHTASDPQWLRAWISPTGDIERHVLDSVEERSARRIKTLSLMIERAREDLRLVRKPHARFCRP